MKINKVTIFLLILLAGVWSFISYWIYDVVKEPEARVLPVKVKRKQLKTSDDKFTLLLDYPNPFGISDGKRSIVNANSKQVIAAKAISKSQPKTVSLAASEAKPESVLKYLGIIQTKSTGRQALLVSINNQESILHKGDKIDGYTIKRATEDSLVLAKRREIKVLLR